jgi:hypothetical protein
MRGPPKIFQCSAKHKILICTEIRGPLELIWQTTSGADFGKHCSKPLVNQNKKLFEEISTYQMVQSAKLSELFFEPLSGSFGG